MVRRPGSDEVTAGMKAGGYYFTRFRAATAADPDRGRYEAWILRLCVQRSGP